MEEVIDKYVEKKEEKVEKEIKKSNREGWIDIIKAIAMIAVVVNHVLNNIIDPTNTIIKYTAFSVTLFVIMAGYTCCISLKKYKDGKYKEYIIKRLRSILVPYIIASIIYVVYENKELDINVLFTHLIRFTASGPFYFILFFSQLILISPLIYIIFNKNKDKIINQVIILVFMLIVSYFLLNFTVINNVYSASIYLFGATYLFAFGIGFFMYFNLELLKKIKYIIFSVSLVCLVGFVFFDFIVKAWSNPPNKFAIIYTLLIAGLIFSLYQIMNQFIRNYDKFFLNKLLIVIGKYSLNIFLYHYLIIQIFNKLNISEYINNVVVTFLIYLILSITIPVFCKIGYDKINMKKLLLNNGGE